jgi:hypothetical protein
VSKRKMSARNDRSNTGERASPVAWAIVSGLTTALVLAGALYYSFKHDLIQKRSIAITPHSSAPAAKPLAPVAPQIK